MGIEEKQIMKQMDRQIEEQKSIQNEKDLRVQTYGRDEICPFGRVSREE